MNSSDSKLTDNLMDRIAGGSTSAIDQLLELHRGYLKRVIQSRMAPEISRRVDASDIVQETCMVISRRVRDFVSRRPTSLRIWMRREAIEQVIDHQRRHVGAKKRSVNREEHFSEVSCKAIVANLISNSPSKALRTEENRQLVVDLVARLSERDQEMLSMRHTEGLSNKEIAEVLQIDVNTSRQRYGRALRRLHQLITKHGVELDLF